MKNLELLLVLSLSSCALHGMNPTIRALRNMLPCGQSTLSLTDVLASYEMMQMYGTGIREDVTELNLSNKNINDLSGSGVLQDKFPNLRTLYLRNNAQLRQHPSQQAKITYLEIVGVTVMFR